MYYLTDYVDRERLVKCLNIYIFDDSGMKETNMTEIIRRVDITFNNRLYRRNIERAARANWLDVSVNEAFTGIRRFLEQV